MFLSRILLLETDKSEFNRQTMNALTSLNRFHEALDCCFPGKRTRNLWRIDKLKDKLYLLILSRDEPDFSSFCKKFSPSENDWETKNYDGLLNSLKNESLWRFRLTANPTKSEPNHEGQKRGKVHACAIVDEQKKWLLERSEKHGFELDEFDVVRNHWEIFTKKDRNYVRILSVTYEGILKIVDVDLFRETLLNGIGRGKAYGMGLMTVIHV